MLALLTLLRPLLPYLAGLLILGGIYGWGYHRGASGVQHKFDAYVIEQREVVARTSAAWNAERAAHEIAILRDQENRDRAFAPIKDRAHALPPELAHIAVPPVAVGVLRDAISAANEATGPAPEPAEAATAGAGAAATKGSGQPEVDLAHLIAWQVDVLDWARECRDRVDAWAQFYSGLRAAASSE